MAKGKGGRRSSSWQARACPDDFEIIFVEKGRLECESHYRARRTTVTRWLEETGKKRLLKKRASYVRYQRQLKKPKATKPKKLHKPRRKIDPKLADMACRHLQSSAGGGWVAYRNDDDSFIVGVNRMTPGKMLDMAISNGFDKRRALEQIRLFAEPN